MATSLILAALATAPLAQEVFELVGPSGIDLGLPNFAPIDLVASEFGGVFMVSSIHDVVLKVQEGGLVQTIADASGDGLGNVLEEPLALVEDASGNVYVACAGSNNVFRIGPSGVSEIIDASGDGFGNSLDRPVDLAIGLDGSVYVCGVGSHNVFRVHPDGTIETVATALGGGVLIQGPVSITVTPTEELFIGCLASNNLVMVEPGGVATEVVACVPFKEVGSDANGTVYAVGGESVYALEAGHLPQVVLDGSAGTVGMCHLDVDSAGNLYVSGILTDNVVRRRPTSTITQIIGPSDLLSPTKVLTLPRFGGHRT